MGYLVHFVGYFVHFGREKVIGHLRRQHLHGDLRIEVNFFEGFTTHFHYSKTCRPPRRNPVYGTYYEERGLT